MVSLPIPSNPMAIGTKEDVVRAVENMRAAPPATTGKLTKRELKTYEIQKE